MVAGAARIRVTFQVDADGILEVTAREETTGIQSSIQVKPSYGLSDNEIETMLRDSITHARDDMDLRNLREQQVDADRLVEAVTAAVAEDGEALLTDAERAAINDAIENIKQARNGDDIHVIKQAIEKLDKASSDFAARRMDSSIRKALKGHTLDEITE
jgi:molecular chaperone HscA